MKRHSTSPPCGNLVDGLPHDCHILPSRRVIRKQWLSRADLGPHKMRNQCKLLSSYQGFARWPSRKPAENLVEGMFKINLDMIKYKICNATTKPLIFQQIRKFRKNDKFRENLDFFKIDFQELFGFLLFRCEWRGTLRVVRAETWLTVYRTIAISG